MITRFTDPAVSPGTLDVLCDTIAKLSPSFKHAAAFSVGILQSLIADAQQQVGIILNGGRVDGVLDGTMRCFASTVNALGIECLQLMPTFKLAFATFVDLLPSLDPDVAFGRLRLSLKTVQIMMQCIVIGCQAIRPTNPILITAMLNFMMQHLGPTLSDRSATTRVDQMLRL